jgi:hypothetical protein
VALASEERASNSFRVSSILKQDGHFCRLLPARPGGLTHPQETPLSLVPGLALLHCEGCQDGHVVAVVQQHVCQLHKAVAPRLPTCDLVRALPELCAERLQQAE